MPRRTTIHLATKRKRSRATTLRAGRVEAGRGDSSLILGGASLVGRLANLRDQSRLRARQLDLQPFVDTRIGSSP